MLRYQHGQWIEISVDGKWRLLKRAPRHLFSVAEIARALDATPRLVMDLFLANEPVGFESGWPRGLLLTAADVAQLWPRVFATQTMRQSMKAPPGGRHEKVKTFNGWHREEKKPCPDCGIPITERSTRCIPCAGKLKGWSKTEIESRGHQQAARWYRLKPCEACGATKKIHRHHRDGDPTNNVPENIAFLCERCHVELHTSI